MVQKQVFKSSERCIYRIQESNLDFYMVIPNSPTISLVLGLMNGVFDDKVCQLSKLQDKAVVVPVLDERILSGISQNRQDFFEYLDKYFSNLINLAHKILTHNKIQLLDTIYFFSEVEYSNFQRWFIAKYNGRVQAIALSSLLQSVVPSSVENSVPEVSPSSEVRPVENVTPVSSIEIPKVEVPTEEVVNPKELSTETKEPGFVSYVLLGVLVAVLSLVFLYFII